MATNSTVDSTAKKGVVRVKDTEPYTKHTSVNNFEEFNAKAAKEPRGHRPVDPRNVRGHANYK